MLRCYGYWCYGGKLLAARQSAQRHPHRQACQGEAVGCAGRTGARCLLPWQAYTQHTGHPVDCKKKERRRNIYFLDMAAPNGIAYLRACPRSRLALASASA